MKPKLVFLISSLISGGAERVVCTLSNSFYLKGYDVAIVLLNSCGKPPYHVESGIEIIGINNDKRSGNILNRTRLAMLTFYKLFVILRKVSPGIVFSFQTSANLWTGMVCSALRIPYFVSERTTPERTINKMSPLTQKLVSIFYKKAKAVIVPSTGIRTCLKQNKYFSNLDNILLIRNYVTRAESFTEEKVHPNKYILGAGRLEYVKGFDRLIDSFAQIKTSDIDLIIAGNGNEKMNLSKRVADLGLNNRVFLVGEKKNIHDYYKQCEVFVLPSRNEGYPNTLIEAMSIGCACIAVNCNFGPSEIINHEDNGLIIEENNIPSLSSLIDEVLTSPVLKTRISDNAKKILITNSHASIVAEWEDLIYRYA